MAQAIISRRGGGSGYATITFNGVSDLKKTDVAGLIAIRTYLAATTVGNYALFGGGTNYHHSTASEKYFTTVEAYNTSLTRTIPTALSQAREELAATTVGNYALFGGGYNGGSLATVDAYDTSLTRTNPTALSQARNNSAATTVGSYALFGGGESSSTVNAYNTSLTRTTPTALSQARGILAATTVGNYALFGGGDNSGSLATVDAYDTSLTRSTPTTLSQARSSLAATTVGNYALFGGGDFPSSSTVDAYNTSLTRSIPKPLSSPMNHLAATTVGDYALFGGGTNVNAYYVNNKVQVYPGTIYKLGSMSSESTSSTMQEIETTAPITGYIKIKDATIN